MISRKSVKEKQCILLGVAERLISVSFLDLKERGTLLFNAEGTHLSVVIKVTLLWAIQTSMISVTVVLGN